jgi:2-polyprenyl-3-methyl-5-hydroxy-6-metoxy-1,4-benzoquinol methylase
MGAQENSVGEVILNVTNDDAIQAWSNASGETPDFEDEGDFARRFLLYPALFELLGNVDGQTVLDAGCGQGQLSRILARKGARVTGVEPAESRHAFAVEREQRERLGITYVKADLSRLTDFSGTFDVVVANMVLQDLADYVEAVRNCVTELKLGGLFIFSVVHPCFEESGATWPRKGYVEVREYLNEHVREQNIAWLFHRPLSSYLNLVLDAGCTLRRVVEPRLSPELAQQIGNDRDVHVPSFLVVAAVREGPVERL